MPASEVTYSRPPAAQHTCLVKLGTPYLPGCVAYLPEALVAYSDVLRFVHSEETAHREKVSRFSSLDKLSPPSIRIRRTRT